MTSSSGAGTGAATTAIASKDTPVEVIELEARKLKAYIDRLRHHDAASQAKAAEAIVRLRQQVDELKTRVAEQTARNAAKDEELKILCRKLEVLSDLLDDVMVGAGQVGGYEPSPACPGAALGRSATMRG